MRIGIIGFGKEGRSILRFFRKSKAFQKADFWVLDKNLRLKKVPDKVKTQLGKNYLKNLSKFDLLFRSPGVAYSLPELKMARREKIKFSSLTNLFFENCPAKIIGITGTKGKGTTSSLIYKILKAANIDVYLAGNIGKPALEILPKLNKNSWVILELSSFQLQDLRFSPHIGVVLDVFPDHQDAHLSLDEYYRAKGAVARYQRSTDRIFYFKHNSISSKIAQEGKGKKIKVNYADFHFFKKENLHIKGDHNLRNAIMAFYVSKFLNVNQKIIVETIKNFKGLKHRLEYVRKIKNMIFYNDSASTNPHTAASAIKSFPDDVKVLIAGGKDKNLNYKVLADALLNSNTEFVILLGENKSKIYKSIKDTGVKIKLQQSLSDAVSEAFNLAKSIKTNKNIIILFSPGSTSFDMFSGYQERGSFFKKIVRELS